MSKTVWRPGGAIWNNEGDVIAKIANPQHWQDFAPGEWADDEFFIEIAPGIDAALIFSLIAAIPAVDR